MSYYEFIGESIADFVSVFSEQIYTCYKTLYWPFSAVDSFGYLFASIFKLVPVDQVKLICLIHIWEIAYESDQWSIQSVMDSILADRNSIPQDIQSDFASVILDSQAKVDYARFESLDMPKLVKQALYKKSLDSND